jgi:parallel beta-helix repeat protein
MKSLSRIFAAVAAAWLLSTGAVRAQSNLLLFISQPGDYIGQGQTHVTTNTADFSFSGTGGSIGAEAFGYGFTFTPGTGTFGVATYANATRWPFNGGNPGIDISGNGRGCNNECGTFQILEFHTNDNGQVDRLWLTYSNSCECFNAPMTGELRFNSQLAPQTPVPKTIRVPADWATIQSAINAASLLAVDTVLVSPGTYSGTVNFNGKRVVLISSGGPAVTTILVPSGSTGVSFVSGETADAVLSGFTVANGSTGISVSGSSTPTIVSNNIVNCGTGLNCNFSSPTIRSNVFSGCSGNGLYLNGAAAPLVEGNVIRTNHGGIGMWAAGSPVIRNNLFQGNVGDAMNMVNQSDANIIQNIIIENTGNGINWLVPSGARGPYVINNTIAKNGAAGIFADGYDINALIANNIIMGAPALSVGTFNDNNPPQVQFNDIFGSGGAAYAGAIANLTGVAGNISADPLITCIPGDDYRLLAGSPAIDAGSNGVPQLPGTDFAGTSRILAGVSNGAALVDLGAFEFNPAQPTSPCMYVNCPGNIVVAAAAGQTSAVVTFPASTGTPAATITSSPPSGSVFPAGTNIVTSTATYGTNTATCTFTVTVVVPPSVASLSASTNVLAGRAINLFVTAGGTGPFTYRWMFENSNISGAVNSTLTISNAQSLNEGIYRVAVGNSVGSITSAPVSIRVLPAPPTIVTNPASVSAPATSNATFSVSAIGSQVLGYNWQFNGATIAGATGSQYVLSGIQSSNSGAYRVIVTNAAGSATSAVATLTVTAMAPYFVTQPAGAQVGAGTSRTLTGLANGSQPISYQWQLNGTNLAGKTQTSLALTNLGLADSGAYTLIASNIAGTTPSAAAQLTVFQVPTLLQGLTNQVVDAGSTVVLGVNAVGSATLVYTWQFNGQPLAAAGPTLALTNVSSAQSGFYRITVTNQFGSISSTGRLSVLGASSTVSAWGDDSGGQIDVPGNVANVVAAAGGDYHTLALRHDGTLLAWGNNSDGQTSAPTNALRFVAIASGAAHNLAVTENGSLIAWGRNDSGQLNIPPAATNGVVAVAAGDSHSVALLGSGTVAAWGDNSLGQINVPQGTTGVRGISAGRNHCLAVRTNGAVTAWGYNAYGQAQPPVLTNAVAVAAGYLHSAALLANGTVVVWGDNSFGQTSVPAGLSNVVAIAAGDFHTLALRADGTVVGWGDDSYHQTDVPAGTQGVAGIASGNYHGLALRPVPGNLLVSMNGSKMVVRWNGPGFLQSAPGVNGPYLDVPFQGNSYTNTDMSAPSKFFRLRR